MATKKQRRRREKDLRHDYEIVYVDHEGNEVEPDEVPPSAGRKSGAGSSKSGKSSKGSSRRGRAPQPPSWRRVAKRGALFAPLFVVTVVLLGGKNASIQAAVFQTLVLLVFFVPFSYFLDSLMWRSYEKKQGRGPAPKR